MSLADDTVVRRQVTVNAPLDRAFSLFTERFGDFKPKEHNMLGAPIAETRFEPHVGGHIYDRGEDGSECRWARVLAYEPPNRVVFSWDIGPSWQLEDDERTRARSRCASSPRPGERTRIELEHRHLDRHGPRLGRPSDGVAHPEGWPLYLDRYADLVGAAA